MRVCVGGPGTGAAGTRGREDVPASPPTFPPLPPVPAAGRALLPLVPNAARSARCLPDLNASPTRRALPPVRAPFDRRLPLWRARLSAGSVGLGQSSRGNRHARRPGLSSPLPGRRLSGWERVLRLSLGLVSRLPVSCLNPRAALLPSQREAALSERAEAEATAGNQEDQHFYRVLCDLFRSLHYHQVSIFCWGGGLSQTGMSLDAQ